MDETATPLWVEDWGLLDYRRSFARQEELLRRHLSGGGNDTLVLVAHPDTVTLGRRGSEADLCYPEEYYRQQGVALQRINRGGLATAHEPGQLVAYPVVALKKKDVRWFAQGVLQVVVAVLAEYGIPGILKDGEPGVWVDGKKICSFGIALKKWVSSHGIALNMNNSLQTFAMIVPCGHSHEQVTSLARELGHPVDLDVAKQFFVKHFCQQFDYQVNG